MITYDDALKLVLKQASSFGVEEVPVSEALNRILSEPLYADRDYPPFNRAAMDGYALKFSDISSGLAEFEVVETIFPAQVNTKGLAPGECYKIMTGASVPSFADIVIRVEDAVVHGDRVSFNLNGPKQWQNISRQGEDVAAANMVLQAPCLVTAPVIALLSVLGRATVMVRRKPSVAIITTGNEVIDPTLPREFRSDPE